MGAIKALRKSLDVFKSPLGPNEHVAYRQQKDNELFQFGRIIALFVVLILLIFIYSDLAYDDRQRIIIFRIIPLSLFLIFYIMTSYNPDLIRRFWAKIFYYTAMVTLQLMGFVIAFICFNDGMDHLILCLQLIVAIIIFLGMRGHTYWLALIYGLPTLFFYAYALTHNPSVGMQTTLMMYFVTVVGLTAMYLFNERKDQQNYLIRMSLEKRGEELAASQAQLKHQNRLVETLLENIPVGIFMVEAPSGKPLVVNSVAQNILGRGIMPDANEQNLGEIYEAFRAPKLEPYPVQDMPIVKGMHGITSSVDDMVIKNPEGKSIQLEVYGTPIRDENDKIFASLVSFRDITHRKAIEAQLYQEKERFKTTLLSVGDGIIATDLHGKVVLTNRVAEHITGWTQVDAYGEPVETVFNLTDALNHTVSGNPVQWVLETGEIFEMHEYGQLESKSGILWHVEVSVAPIKDPNGAITGAVLVFRDVTEKKEHQDAITYLSYHDYLTGLYNRRFFETELKRLDVMRNYPISLVMTDVNGLKLMNDTFGHEIGDDLLIEVARIFKEICRSDDLIARIGGDEFVILLPKTDASEAKALINRIEDELSATKVNGVLISVAFGIETKETMDYPMEQVFKQAEDKMYRNKVFSRKSYSGLIIDQILKVIFDKSEREERHSKQVAHWCEAIAKAMELSDEVVKEMHLLGLVHDIGNINVSREVLRSTEPLTDTQMAEIKNHCVSGYRTLKAISDMSESAEFVLSHHERYDGEGYPKGIKGKDIPLEARICAIAEAYDAMTEDQPYRKAISKEAAIEALVGCSGTQFDPEIVKVFIEKVLKK